MRPSPIWMAGEWTDGTSMMIAIAEAAATGYDLRDESTQGASAVRLEWRAILNGWPGATAHDPGTRDVRTAASSRPCRKSRTTAQ